MPKYNILLVDDQNENLSSTKDLLHRWGYQVDAAANSEEAIDYVKSGLKDYAVALVDYRMPGKLGTDTAKEIRAVNDEVVVLIYSAYPSVESLTATIRIGALNFIDKNEDLTSLRNALETACKEYERTRKLKSPINQDEATKLIGKLGMVGCSAKLANVANQVERFRNSKKPVLILGETGVGKEMVAKALHMGHKDSFFVVNCAAFNGNSLVESELFGHEKGAFTGAIVRKVGILEAAKGGTVYLDELHHLDLQTQGKLLRALREKKIRRVGGLKEEDVDFRLVASSWPNIEERVANGSVLPDLYYRLKFLTIEIPPLRERPEDIAPLVAHYCQKHFQETGIRKQFLMRTVRYLEQYSWPGNVGELDGYVSAILTESDRNDIDESLLDQEMLTGVSSPWSVTFSEFEARQERERKEFIQNALNASKSAQHAAQRLGLKRTTLHSIITRLGLREM